MRIINDLALRLIVEFFLHVKTTRVCPCGPFHLPADAAQNLDLVVRDAGTTKEATKFSENSLGALWIEESDGELFPMHRSELFPVSDSRFGWAEWPHWIEFERDADGVAHSVDLGHPGTQALYSGTKRR